LPAIYAWAFLYASVNRPQSGSLILASSGTSVYRLLIMCLVVTVWGLRLTYNFWRKGGYSLSEEDYRWVHVRKMFNYPERKLVFHLFNFAFTAFFQNYLLLAIVCPMWYVQTLIGFDKSQQPELNKYDVLVGLLYLFFLTIEIVADEQQWKFQTNKYKWLAEQKSNKKGGKSEFTSEEIADFKRGFLIKGLFKYSRHPNFFGEVTIWWVFYFFTLSAQSSQWLEQTTFSVSSLVNYSLLGTLSLSLLFHKSADLTEKITGQKYPEYAKYQQRVSRIIPFFTSYNPNKVN
jgi:steroid 5-alpha reductase family enzyme